MPKKNVKIVFFIIALAILGFFWQKISYIEAVNEPVAESGEDVGFTVGSGQTVNDVAEALDREGLIISADYFLKYLKKEDLDEKLKAGEYILSPTLSIVQIAGILTRGDTIDKEKEIKIIEGWTNRKIADYLGEKGFFGPEDFLALVGSPISEEIEPDKEKLAEISQDYPLLADKPAEWGLEGYLFPDTYRVFKEAGPEEIARKMLANLERKITPEMLSEIKRQGKTIHEIITMASIVEKEVRSADDMKLVAGIFYNRIQSGQPLQSCASLAYILGVNKTVYSTEDTQVNSIFNTYRNAGLPPAPIANPGLQAIESSIYPAETDYNYFLTDLETGETVFSKTFDEHVRNKNKYLK